MTVPSRSAGVPAIVTVLAFLTTAPLSANAVNEALLTAYIAAWNGGALDSLDTTVDDDFARHGNYGSARSRRELGDLIGRYRSFYRDMHIEVEDVIVGHDKAAMRWRFSGGFGETSFQIEALNFSMFHFDNGRISAEWVVGNTIDFWTGMGYTVMPPGTKMIPPPVDEHAPSPTSPPVDPLPLTRFVEKAGQRAGKAAGEVEISTDVDALLSLDGSEIGWLTADESVSFPVSRGTHRLEATSRGGSIFQRETVEVGRRKRVQVTISAPGRVIVHPRHRTTEDLETGLMWQLTDNGDDISQPAAATSCRELDQGGYTDWRLPTIFELEQLYSPAAAGTKRFHTIPGITLTGCCPWTSTAHGDFHWTFVFYNGMRYLKYRSIGRFSRALCVRETWGAGTAPEDDASLGG
jgi:hypothetical protein